VRAVGNNPGRPGSLPHGYFAADFPFAATMRCDSRDLVREAAFG
jgi:hypothetical protein